MTTTKGFTIMEVLISTFVLAVTVVGLSGFITLILKSTHEGQRRIVATALANEKMEMIRNLSYDSVGTVGGIPTGPIAQSEEITRNNSTYTVNTDIRYIDDPFDGSGSADSVNADYKQARVEVLWDRNLSDRTVLLISQIAPSGVEGGSSLGTLEFQALDATGAGVAGATVHLGNSTVSPVVDLTTFTNNEGTITIPGLEPSIGTYELSVTKNGYTTEQTYDQTSSFIPDADHSHLSSVVSDTTSKTFSIDLASDLTITTKSDTGVPIGGVPYTISGTKKIGVDGSGQPVYILNRQDTTDPSGTYSYQGMTWDTYSFVIDGAATGYDIKETSVPVPLGINPGTSTNLDVVLVPHEEFTLHVTVVDTAGVPIPNATVRVIASGYDQVLSTNQYGQVFFSPLPIANNYVVNVDAEGYQQNVQPTSVDGNTRIQVILN